MLDDLRRRPDDPRHFELARPPPVIGLNATPAGIQKQAALRFSNEEEKIHDTKLWLADGEMYVPRQR